MNWNEIKARRWLHAPGLESWQKKILDDMRARVPRTKDVLWILSSGTQSVHSVKAIGLTEEAILIAADGANRHLQSSREDRWLVAIPEFHIGGLSIYARAQLSGASVFSLTGKWSAASFAKEVQGSAITLTSLVPTQVHDLVSAELTAPSSLRAIVVGGGALDSALYVRARTLGWNVLPSYGLTECASQVATASLGSLRSREYPKFEILPHVEVDIREQRVFLRSGALCRWIATGRSEGQFTLEAPVRNGWLATEDLAAKKAGQLRFLGRRDSVVKVLGNLVSIPEVEAEVEAHFRGRGWSEFFLLLATPHERRGASLVIVTDSSANLRDWQEHIESFNRTASKLHRLRGPCWLPKIPRTALGKIPHGQLKEMLYL